MINLRPYQDEAVVKALWHFHNYANPFIVLAPTGSGKSFIISEICHRLNEPILILQPTKEILEQNYAKLRSYGITDIGIYSASMNSKTIDKFTYATIGSIYKKPELFSHFKYVLIDECHLVDGKKIDGMYNKFFRAIDCKHICGLTATPYRLIQKYYQDGGELFYTSHLQILNRIYPFFFKKFAFKIGVQELINQGYLCKLQYKSYEDFDVSNIKINTTGADYDEAELERFWSDSRLERLSHIIGEIDKDRRNVKTIIDQLTRKTLNGKIKWQKVDENTFTATMKHGIVELVQGYLNYEISIRGLNDVTYLALTIGTSAIEYDSMAELFNYIEDQYYTLQLPEKLREEIIT